MSDEEDFYYSDQEDQLTDEDDEVRETTKSAVAASLDEQDLIELMNQLIHSVSSLLSLPPDTCSILLRNFRWDAHKLEDVWFSDQSQACQIAGVQLTTNTTTDSKGDKKSKKRSYTCPICYTRCPRKDLSSAACRHMHCKFCWKSYIMVAIDGGASCLTLKCPDPDCSVSIDEALINKFTDEAAKAKYKRLLVNNFVECSKNIKWCPAPGCKYAIHLTREGGLINQADVSCKCTYTFCWDCVGEPHRPLNCKTALKWHEKNDRDSANSKWMLSNTKPCPKCHRSIEKNHGCNHMTCSPPCNFQFCWVCLVSIQNHIGCNKFSDKDLKGPAMDRQAAEISWQKYNHYYKRWTINNSSELKARKSLKIFEAKSKQKLFELYSDTFAELERSFIPAWKQIIECRRVLKWTYAYGYYLPKNHDERKRVLFEDLQGQAETALERLHHSVEKELEPYLDLGESCEEKPKTDISKDFFTYKLKVIQLTNTTRNFFNNLVQGLETGLF